MSDAAGSRDEVAAAREAGLRYVTDDRPGITRRRAGKGFTYRDPFGGRITDRAEIKRIRAIGIPPAWTSVWICPNPRGHVQATGRDAKGRKQYRYHPDWRAVRDASKFDRMLAFGGLMVAVMVWRPQGLLAHREPTIKLAGSPRDRPVAVAIREKAT